MALHKKFSRHPLCMKPLFSIMVHFKNNKDNNLCNPVQNLFKKWSSNIYNDNRTKYNILKLQMTHISKHGRNASIKLLKNSFSQKTMTEYPFQVTWILVPLHHMTVYRR